MLTIIRKCQQSISLQLQINKSPNKNPKQMYANYLIDVGKLLFIVGETQTTTQFRTLFQSGGSNKEKIFYKCMQELPNDTFKKEKPQDERRGIIRKDWFGKILNKNPQMIVMTFSCVTELGENQLWQDRLKVMIKKINKVYDMMRSNNKEQVRLRIIVLISKHTFGGVNLHQKITNFLKTYQKELVIIQAEYYAKEITKIRSQWVYALQKNYDNKYKKIQKRKDQSPIIQRRLGCMVKMFILSQVLSKKEQREKFAQTYKALRVRFSQLIRSVTILNHNQIRQLRAVSDIVFLRFLKTLIQSNTSPQFLFRQTLEHMNYFKLKNLGFNETSKYYYYEEVLWRSTFIENYLQILYKHDLVEAVTRVSLCEILNQLVACLHALAAVPETVLNYEKELGGKIIQHKSDNYVGLLSYKAQQIAQTDVIYTFLSQLILHKRDNLSKGIQLITRYKTMNIFKTNQLLFLNVYLLRFYFQDNKFQNLLTTYQEIMKQQISRSNYFLLNQIFKEIQNQFETVSEEHKVMFYGVSALICDYFENQIQLENRLEHLLTSLKTNTQLSPQTNNQTLSIDQTTKPTQLNQYNYSLKKKSSIASVSCYIQNQFVYIQEQIRLKLDIFLNPTILRNGCKITIVFNHTSVNQTINIPPRVDTGIEGKIEKVLIVTPLEHFTKDQSLRIETVRIQVPSAPNLMFMIYNNHITFPKYTEAKIFTNIRCPDLQLNLTHSTYYINQVTKFQINIEKLQGFTVDAKCSIKEEDVYGKTEVFNDIEERINLTNSNYYQELVTKDKVNSQFWLKCNKVGEKVLKLTFNFNVEKIIQSKTKTHHDLLTDFCNDKEHSPSEEQQYILRQPFTITRQLRFTIKQLFTIQKTFHEFSNDDSKLLPNKNIPVDKKIVCILEITPSEDVHIKQIGQHKNPKKISYLKEIKKRQVTLRKSSKLRLNMVFQLGVECKDEIELFLMSTYIKWTRVDGAGQQYENLFLDKETKINCFISPLSIFINATDNYQLKKNQLSKITLKIRNHSDFKNHILAIVQGNATILRVGEKTKEIFVQPRAQNTLEFDVFPITSGLLPIPSVKVFVDGVQRNLNIKNGQLIKCL